MGTEESERRAIPLLGELRRRGIRVWAEDGRLRMSAPAGAATPEIREQLALHKQAILALLARESAREGSSARNWSRCRPSTMA